MSNEQLPPVGDGRRAEGGRRWAVGYTSRPTPTILGLPFSYSK